MKKQTAVEWLLDQLIAIGQLEIPEGSNVVTSIVEQAKEVEEQQIMDAFEVGYENGACVNEGKSIYHGSNYYNEIFKSE